MVEIGETVHSELGKKREKDRGKLEDKWIEGIYLGSNCPTGI
jgi:hypothetical protein